MLSVLLDTSFFIRLLNDTDPLHSNAKEYYKHFLENDIIMKMSTVSIAEFCVRDEIENLPLDTLQILPFNLEHAKVAGQFARAIFKQKNITGIEIKPRAIIPNDSKLFAQCHVDKTSQYYITSDTESVKTISLLNNELKTNFTFVDINNPVNEVFGILF